MSILDTLRGFLGAFRRGASSPRPSSSLANTIKDSTHVRGAHGGLARAGTEQQHDIVAKGHEHYQKSFDKDDD